MLAIFHSITAQREIKELAFNLKACQSYLSALTFLKKTFKDNDKGCNFITPIRRESHSVP